MLGVVIEYLELLDFWFGELTEGVADDEHRTRWFVASSDFDQQCASRFGRLLNDVNAIDWGDSPRARLASIILYDQLPRNIYRGQREAFAHDQHALSVARCGVEQRADLELNLDERAFFYMPFEHSESLLDQHTAVGLFGGLRDAAPKPLRNQTGNSLRFAQQHRDIIVRFGRFPHRNSVLGRDSSPEELAFVAGGDGFGQN
jgi:uncharacterized protein (DUF924 family)